MAQPRFNGQRFTNPIDPLGFHAESRHRVNPQISRSFMSNETHFAENVSGNQVFHSVGSIFLKTMKAAIKSSMKVAFDVAIKGGVITKEIAEGVATAVAKELEDVGKVAYDAAITAGKTAKEASEEAIQKITKTIDDMPLKELGDGADAFKATMKDSFSETMEASLKTNPSLLGRVKDVLPSGTTLGLGATGFVVVAGVGLAIFGDDGLMSEWIDGMTGLNCDEKALDAGLNEGDDDYKEFVLECQKRAEMKMAVAGTVIGLGLCLVLWLILK